MPIPTDTFWNIKRLNWVFAATAVIMVLLIGASIIQDYDKSWRGPQRSARDFEAYYADYKASRTLTPEQQRELADLDKEIAEASARVDARKPQMEELTKRIQKRESEISTLEFSLNNLKSTLQVMETNYQDALTVGNKKRAAALDEELKAPRTKVAADQEEIAAWKKDVEDMRAELKAQTAEYEALAKKRNELQAQRVELEKKRDTLQPKSLLAKVSGHVRAAPLMQFINPSERVAQDVLPDVLTEMPPLRVTTIDRCRSCHVNVARKEFTEDKVLAMFEDQLSGIRSLTLPAEPAKKAADPKAVKGKPGAAAMGEFWHHWAKRLAPASIRANASRIGAMTKTVGSGASVTFDGKPVKDFAYDPAATDATAVERQDAILVELVKAWARYNAATAAAGDKSEPAVVSEGERVKVEIEKNVAKAAADAAHAAALKYPEELRAAIESELSSSAQGADAMRLLRDRYRRALVGEINKDLDERGGSELDDSRLMLAHPPIGGRQDLWVDAEGKHSYEAVGCTSCHDGSGQETDFVLAAHMPRPIWVDQKTGAPVLPTQLRTPPAEHHGATLDSMLHAVFPASDLVPKLDLALHTDAAAHGEAESEGSHADVSAALAVPAPQHANPTPYVDPVTGQEGRAVPQGQYWAGKYERESGTSFKDVFHYWDWPMRPPQYLQANCVRCHTQANDIREAAPVVNEGRALFSNLGCANCHQMDSIAEQEKRKVGTDLRNITAKLSPEFINAWIWAPKAFRPSTKMPHFFMLENSSSAEEIRRTRQEVRAITEYLVQTANQFPKTDTGGQPVTGADGQVVMTSWEPAHRFDSSLKGDPKAGQLIFNQLGCLGCHTNLNDTNAKGQTVAEQWITTDLIKNGKLSAQLEPEVSKEVAERLTSGLEETVKKELITAHEKKIAKAEESRLTKEVEKELGAAPAAADPKKPTKEEKKAQADHKKKVTAEVKKRVAAAVKEKMAKEEAKALAGLEDAKKKALVDLPGDISKETEKALAKRVAAEAKKLFEGMSYNERQLYCVEHFEPPVVIQQQTPPMPGEPAPPPSPYTLATYADGTPKPIFMHHGPELSGVGTKLTAGRSPEQARAWLFDWLKEPRHYSEYTVMPRLRLSDKQTLDLVEYLLAQQRGDEWKAGTPEIDTAKLIELTALMLRSRYSFNVAFKQADDQAELTRLAAESLTTKQIDEKAAAARAAKMTNDERRLVFLGKKLVGHYGCMSCHEINGMETVSSPCANLSDWGQKAITKLDYAFLDEHKAHDLPKTTTLPLVNGLSVEGSNLILPGGSNVARADKENAPVEVASASEGAAAGAAAAGHAAKPASGVPTVTVGWPHVGHTRDAWITQKLKNTRIYDRGKVLLEPTRRGKGSTAPLSPEDVGKPYDKLRMPTFYLNDAQVDAIVTFVLSNRDRLITERLTNRTTTDTAKQIAYGRHLTQRFNCVSCHEIEGNRPAVQQYYERSVLTTEAPPSLRGEGNKIQHDWLHGFLLDVIPLRPIPKIRMPSFPLDEQQTAALAAYFAAASNKEAKQLKSYIAAIDKHIESAQKAEASRKVEGAKMAAATAQPSAKGKAAAPTTRPAATATAASTAGEPAPLIGPGDDWYRFPTYDSPMLAGQRAALEDWALANGQIVSGQLDPLKNSQDDLDKNYKTILFKARFAARLYDSPYPFTEAPRVRMSDEDFKRGEQLFYEMQCLSCHAMGGDALQHDVPPPPGVKAPNLALAAQRLQRRWVRHWVQEPAIIQVGTAMPPFFTGLPVFAQEGQVWPLGQPLGNPADQEKFVRHVEENYGKTVHEQTDLVLDFLYEAGARNYHAVQPTGTIGWAAVPKSPEQGPPPTATQPGTETSGDPSMQSPSGAPTEKVPTDGPATQPAEKGTEIEGNPERQPQRDVPAAGATESDEDAGALQPAGGEAAPGGQTND